MRLKEIKPGMVIHCKNIAEYERLEEETIKNGYGELPLHNHSEDFIKKVGFYINYKKTLWGGLNKNYIEFSDLILPEMTAEELLNILNEIIHCGVRRCDECPLAENGETLCTDDAGGVKISNPDKLISICQQWKANHEKKEPEIEWVYRVFGEENYGEKFFQTEEEAIKRCEELAKLQKTKQYARYERVCRVKAVE